MEPQGTYQHCSKCQCHTYHQIIQGDHCIAKICTKCIERSVYHGNGSTHCHVRELPLQNSARQPQVRELWKDVANCGAD